MAVFYESITIRSLHHCFTNPYPFLEGTRFEFIWLQTNHGCIG